MLKLNMWKFLQLFKYNWNISVYNTAWIYAAAAELLRAETKKPWMWVWCKNSIWDKNLPFTVLPYDNSKKTRIDLSAGLTQKHAAGLVYSVHADSQITNESLKESFKNTWAASEYV